MAPLPEQHPRVQNWLAACLDTTAVEVDTAHNLKQGPERETWDCAFALEGRPTTAVLTLFKPGDLDTVNTSLPPAQVARKCLLAMRELPRLGIPTPTPYGTAVIGREAGLACQRLESTAWVPGHRLQAAAILARIHSLAAGDLSAELQSLARQSDPRAQRTTGSQAPVPAMATLVHGDYFSANILPTANGLKIIDWETFAWGDPMWDLGFLIGADRDLPRDEVESVIAEYAKSRPVHREQLQWHQRRWADSWQRRKTQ